MTQWPLTLPRVAEFAEKTGRCAFAGGLRLTGDVEISRAIRQAFDEVAAGCFASGESASRISPISTTGATVDCCLIYRASEQSEAEAESKIESCDKNKSDNGWDESYELRIEPDQLTIMASHARGWFYALQTLGQLVAVHSSEGAIPCGVIRDRPRFRWRGSMIDSARHLQSVDWILRHLDRMAALKLNRLHWHLADDEAWRPEIKRYPELVEKAAWRGKGAHRYGGFYSHEQMRQVVDYARERFITVVPEIDMPGHCNAALAVFPELSCTGETLTLADEGWNAFTSLAGRRAFCSANEQVYTFIQHVFEELADVFDSPHLHIGGDETPHQHWEQCPQCQALLSDINGKASADLRIHFLKRIHAFCREKLGRSTIAWTEGVSDQLPQDQIVHAWFPGEAAIAARQGYQVINSNHEWTYLDYPASQEDARHKPDWMIVLPLEKIYHFDPLPDGLEAEHASRILGSEAPLWTEHAASEQSLEHQLMPRLIAFSEALWSPRVGRSFDDFQRRLESHEKKQSFGTVSGLAELVTPQLSP